MSTAAAARWNFASDKPLWEEYDRQVHEAIGNLADSSIVVDLGGGRRCLYTGSVRDDQDLRMIAVDISAEELALNRDVTETRVADVVERLPFDDGSVDLIVSRTLLEHVDGVPQAVRNMWLALKPGGQTIHFVPCRYSLFGLASRALPHKVTVRALHAIDPTTREQVEFPTVYDHCYPSAMRRVFAAAGFRSVHIDVCWAQPGYFESLVPVFLLTSLYESFVKSRGMEDAAAYMIVRAQR
jgi:SAM-dependent methyltransferase